MSSSAPTKIVDTPRKRRGVLLGIGAGVIAIGCCVGPVVAALLGVISATVAFELATDLYDNWGWGFKLAGLGFAVAAIFLTVRRARTCNTDPHVGRLVSIIALTGLVTYGLFYAGTTWLGGQAIDDPPPALRVEGDSTQQRVASAITEVQGHYPYFQVTIDGLSATAVRFVIGLEKPNVSALTDEYAEEIVRRAEDSREAAVVLMKGIAEADPAIQHFSAYEDRLYIPIWSRTQILRADPNELRNFQRYNSFVFSAEDSAGHAALFQNRSSN